MFPLRMSSRQALIIQTHPLKVRPQLDSCHALIRHRVCRKFVFSAGQTIPSEKVAEGHRTAGPFHAGRGRKDGVIVQKASSMSYDIAPHPRSAYFAVNWTGWGIPPRLKRSAF